MTSVAEFNRYECPRIDALDVNAYFDLSLKDEDPTKLIFDSSWGTIELDLTPAIKAGETVTHLSLDPADNPTYLRYDNESGAAECIHGDDLSRIISFRYLKDVSQESEPADGDVYMYNAETNLFEPFDLKTFVNDTNTTIGRMQATINQLINRISDIENLIYNYPADKTTKIARGQINVYGDITNTNSHANGIFTHDPNSDITNDLYFS